MSSRFAMMKNSVMADKKNYMVGLIVILLLLAGVGAGGYYLHQRMMPCNCPACSNEIVMKQVLNANGELVLVPEVKVSTTAGPDMQSSGPVIVVGILILLGVGLVLAKLQSGGEDLSMRVQNLRSRMQ